jgi:hypothetical protein
VQALTQSLAEAKLEKHPDKTFIGRTEKGFDFLGYHFNPKGLSVAVVTWEKFAARWHRLYEQERSHPERRGLLGDYVRRWQRWATAGIGLVTWERQALRTVKTPLESGAGNAKHRSILCACSTSGYAD